jgi:quercetin dioxygenase-like cupin family protein
MNTNPLNPLHEVFSQYLGNFDWKGVDVLTYKDDDGNPSFKDVTRRKLYAEGDGSGIEVRYFEVSPGGHTSLEKHEHTHTVIPIRGSGSCLVQDRVIQLSVNDVVYVPSWAWHQFRASENEELGFLCMVKVERDRPTLPTSVDIEKLRENPEVSAFIRTRKINP